MAYRRKALPRGLSALLAAVLGAIALSSPATAQVSIVPDRADGGGTRTFAFRLANERTDTKSTRLELVFPATPPVPYVKVASAPGWTATIRPRPLDPPIEADGKVIREVVGALVFEGGAIGPRQFEQFLVTMGPLPAEGRLLLGATQTFANGAVSRWDQNTAPAPVINFGAGSGAGGGAAPAAVAPAGEVDAAQPFQVVDTAAPADQGARSAGTTGGPPFAVLWGALGLALAVIAVVGYRSHRRGLSTAAAEPDTAESDTAESAADEPDTAGPGAAGPKAGRVEESGVGAE
ncbi:DUF1775 domain-containing protein [Actinokineospora spheciospongiae]|uniref:DUF1775 domain-containing protein n=1 Tax=Actinokineospora spheciospongiae TaxID=909613 RepID=UPI000D717CB0|nr:DUF1775 domain-containing protein [Actinokineospora spheciospongiae]PWW53710.1 uncharacterized protein YcnI [Actinokineospora spheciospongiae]